MSVKTQPEDSRPAERTTLEQLAALQLEIDEDLTHGRISQADYEWTSQLIALGVRKATEPLPPQAIRVVGIPNKGFDIKAYARVINMQAERRARRKH